MVPDNGQTAVSGFDVQEVCDKFKQLHPIKMSFLVADINV